MAERYTPEEIQEIFRAYDDAIKSNTPVSKELAMAMADAQKGVKNYTRELNDSLKRLGSSITGTVGALSRGEEGASVFNKGLESAADAADKFASQFGIVGFVIGKLVKAVTFYATEVNKQSDALFKTYQDLNKFGAATAGGMQDIFTNMQKLGYGIESLSQMTELLRQNSTTLAQFGGTVGRGTKLFAELAENLQYGNVGRELREMGISTDAINRGSAGYLKMQSALGRTQRDIGNDLANQTINYIKNLDTLSRLTGKSAEQMQADLDEAMGEDAFNQVMYDLDERVKRGGPDAAAAQAQKDKIISVFASLGPELRKDYVRSLGGNVEAMGRIMFNTPRLMQDMKDASIGAAEVKERVAADAKRFANTFGPSAGLGVNIRDISVPLKELRETSGQLTDAQQKELEAMQKVGDPLVKSQVDMRMQQMLTKNALQDMVNFGVKPATSAMSALAGATNKAAGVPATGKPGSGAQPASGMGGTRESRRQEAVGGAPGAAVPVSGAGAGRTVTPGDIAKVLEAGAGFTTIQTMAGDRQRREGTRAWRNNNPGNIEYGKFAIGQGAVGSDGRFAVFPTKEMGDLARENLLFGGSYGGLTISQAIAKYAPSHENDTQRYLQQVLGATMAGPDTIMSSLNAGQRRNLLSAMERIEGYKVGSVMAAKDGGTFSGPLSGYRAMLHGTEAVVPLPNGKSIPVEIPGFSANFSDQTALMAQQLGKMDELIRAMRSQVDVSTKILQRAS
jgi:hypothetical protein